MRGFLAVRGSGLWIFGCEGSGLWIFGCVGSVSRVFGCEGSKLHRWSDSTFFKVLLSPADRGAVHRVMNVAPWPGADGQINRQ